MKYCPECGQELKNKVVKPVSNNYRKCRIAASTLLIVSSCLCLILAIFTVGSAIWHATYENYSYYYDYSYEYYELQASFLSVMSAITLFAFFSGLFSGIFLLYRRFFSIVMSAHVMVIIVGLLTVGYSFPALFLLGVPILTMGIISIFLLNYAKKDFIS
jgi:hypothetical protein